MVSYNKKKISIRKVKFGKNVTIIEPVNLYECEIGDNTVIGPFVEIQKGVIVGKNCKIQSHSFICEGVKIENNVFIGHGTVFINDIFATGQPAKGNQKLWKNTLIKNNVSIGSNVTLLPVEVKENIVIGAGSVVTKSLLIEKGVYAGNPARRIK